MQKEIPLWISMLKPFLAYMLCNAEFLLKKKEDCLVHRIGTSCPLLLLRENTQGGKNGGLTVEPTLSLLCSRCV